MYSLIKKCFFKNKNILTKCIYNNVYYTKVKFLSSNIDSNEFNPIREISANKDKDKKLSNLEGINIIGGIRNANLTTGNSSDFNVPTINIENMINKSDAFEDYEIPIGYHSDYEILNRLGSGKYSQVYEGINIVKDKYVIIKVLKPVKKKKVRREVAILNLLKGHSNIVNLLEVIIDPSSKTPALIYEKVNNIDFRVLFPKLNLQDIKYYLKCILNGLIFAHSKGIMHRDIKPHNIIIDPSTKTLKIIDWGLAEVYAKEVDYSVRVASRYFKSPELLLDNTKYDYSLDLWSLGCLMAGLIFKKEPFFHGSDNFDQLIKIVKVVGSNSIHDYINKFNLKPNSQYEGLLNK